MTVQSGSDHQGPEIPEMPGRNDWLKFPHQWLECKRAVDKVDPELWRVHDKLYDLKDFAKVHPGGAQWIELTKGTDITEAFEVSHLFEEGAGASMLRKFYVCDSLCPRTSKFTFETDGFYKTLKRKAVPILKREGTGPNNDMLFIQDGLAFVYNLLFIATVWSQSKMLAVVSGLALGMSTSCAHNFIHQRDTWRRYYFDMAALGSSRWRVSHAISHHLYPNTLQDYEVTILYPYLESMVKEKGFCHKKLAPIYCSFFFLLAMPIEWAMRTLHFILGVEVPHIEELIPLLYMALMGNYSSTFLNGFLLFTLMQCICGYWLIFTALIATHRHPLLYHAGDESHPTSRDWGIHQLDTVRDVEKSPSLFWVATSFGNHLLHHLFPTVDHSKLDLLWPALKETCLEFDLDYQYMSHMNMLAGLPSQLAREEGTTFMERERLRCPQDGASAAINKKTPE